MPNWCDTHYCVVGDKKEIDELYKSMTDVLESEKSKPGNLGEMSGLIPLLEALGAHDSEMYARGTYSNVSLDGEWLRFDTDTAWAPSYDAIEALQKKFPSLRFYYVASDGDDFYETNDEDEIYFK